MKTHHLTINHKSATLFDFFEFGVSTYSNTHSEDECDICLSPVGAKNLYSVPFLYKDMNDTTHEDLSYSLFSNPDLWNEGYHQYFVCDSCWPLVDR